MYFNERPRRISLYLSVFCEDFVPLTLNAAISRAEFFLLFWEEKNPAFIKLLLNFTVSHKCVFSKSKT